MMLHLLSGQWPFPGEAVQVNHQDHSTLIGVCEFDRREEYINLIGNEHPLMTLIQGCLSNSPSHRPTSSEVHQRVSAVAADYPPSFTNRVEMMERIKALGEEKETLRNEKDNTIAENELQIAEMRTEKDDIVREKERALAELSEVQSNIESPQQSHSIEIEVLHIQISDLKTDNEHLQTVLNAEVNQHETIQDTVLQQQEKQVEAIKKERKLMEEQHNSTINTLERNYLAEKEAMESKHRTEMELMIRNNQEQIEALIHSHQCDMLALEQQLSHTKEQHALQLTAMEDEHHTVKQAMEQQYQAQLKSKKSELSAKNTLISSKSNTIQGLQVKLGQALGTSSSKDNLSIFSPGVKLTFTECTKTPVTSGGREGIVIGKNMYVGVGFDRKVFKYSITDDTWSTLPQAPVLYTRIGYLYKKILLIGGWLLSTQATADIHEFNETSQQWVRSTSIPPMPTARSSLTVISWLSPPALIVCGGRDQQHQPMTVVEVYHSRTSQWHTVSPMPFPRALMTHTVIHNMLYLVGGYEGSGFGTHKKTVLSTSIPQLLETCLQPSPTQWQSLPIPNVPYYKSTAASLGGCLLVMGGLKDLTIPPKPNSIVSSVHAYCPFTSSWILVGELPQVLYSCITATLPTGELLMIGGWSSSDDSIDTTYKSSLLSMLT